MNFFKPFIYVSIIGAVVLLVINLIGKRKGYYKKGQENFLFGKIMHFFGGFFVAMFLSGFTQYWPLVIVLTFLVGVFWEIGEYFRGIYIFKKFGAKDDIIELRDTVEDLICDILGAFILLSLSYIIQDMFWVFIGVVAATLSSVQLIPQAIKIFRTKSAKDISLLTFIIILLGSVSWLLYGLHIKDPFIITTNSMVLILSSLIVVSKFLFK